MFFVLTISVNVFAQSGCIYYKKQLISANEESSEGYFKQASILLKIQEYELSYNKDGSLYKKVEKLSIENNLIVESFAQSISEFSGEVYHNPIKKTTIHKKEFSGSSFLIHKKTIKWTLTSDTLRIDNYLCYKATTLRTIKNSEGIHKLLVTAWYTPNIPLLYGPDGYCGLPGLILQLENNGILTTVSKINFFNDKIIKISYPSKGKEVTEDEYNEIVSEKFENRKG
ncbi:GLPGLI family protein [Flaviramulus basaltis]|uniref:GLPGLI family protein n=2 Tax=Flaviramulus basaltis TaxID=369401 RepID=A0A1K2ICL5_9FLAO|nr:GLPGLI family protein [Flaviramulus basaltis]